MLLAKVKDRPGSSGLSTDHLGDVDFSATWTWRQNARLPDSNGDRRSNGVSSGLWELASFLAVHISDRFRPLIAQPLG
jgi:hypothetical protein